MKPTPMHVIRREGGRYVFTNQAGQTIELPGSTTMEELIARGIIVRVHQRDGPIAPEAFIHTATIKP